jgi:hypothetical protein
MKKLIRNILNESAGISFEVREWSDILYNEITNNDGQERIIIDGYDHYETYKKFGIDYAVVFLYDRVTGYIPEKSGYDKDGYYVVVIYVQPQIINGSAQYDLRSTLNHELKHAYQDYQRISKGYTNIDKSKESEEFYTNDFINLLNNVGMSGPIKQILKQYYYVSNLERDAYLENVYDKNNTYEMVIRNISNTDFNTFKRGADNNWSEITQLDIPLLKKFNSSEDFIDYSSKRLKHGADKILKKINKLKYIHNI